MTLTVGKSLRLEGPVPDVRESIPLYRVTDVVSFSRGNDDVRKMIDSRVKRWSGIFTVDAEPQDQGDTILFLGEESALEVFVPSDSVWWTDRRLAFAEEPPKEALPSEDEAVERARGLIAEMGVEHDSLYVAAVTTTNASVSTDQRDNPEIVATGITVTFGYRLDDLPVFGPGARIRVSFAGGGALAEFARFWRDTEEVTRVAPIHPYQAIERLAGDERFADLAAAGLEVALEELQLGYYAAGPSEFQRYLLPVYEARGRVHGGELEDDAFLLYVAATDTDATELKARAGRDQGRFRRVFGSY